jgi:hypothetical protein
MAQFLGFRCQGVEVLDPETLYETSSVRNTEKIERRTPNIEHSILMALRFIYI